MSGALAGRGAVVLQGDLELVGMGLVLGPRSRGARRIDEAGCIGVGEALKGAVVDDARTRADVVGRVGAEASAGAKSRRCDRDRSDMED